MLAAKLCGKLFVTIASSAGETWWTAKLVLPRTATAVSLILHALPRAVSEAVDASWLGMPWQLESSCTFVPLGRQAVPAHIGAQLTPMISESASTQETAAPQLLCKLPILIILIQILVGLGGVEPPTRSLGKRPAVSVIRVCNGLGKGMQGKKGWFGGWLGTHFGYKMGEKRANQFQF